MIAAFDSRCDGFVQLLVERHQAIRRAKAWEEEMSQNEFKVCYMNDLVLFGELRRESRNMCMICVGYHEGVYVTVYYDVPTPELRTYTQ